MKRPRLFRVEAHASYHRATKRVLVLHRRGSPSVDYYLKPRLRTLRDVPVDYRSFDTLFGRRRGPGVSTDGLFVVVCRYLSFPWWLYLWRHRRSLSGVAFFVDDDVPGGVLDRTQTLGYRAFLFINGLLPTPFISALTSEVWVSTPALSDLHGRSAPTVLPPRLPPDEHRPTSYVTVFYHGETHRLEIGFLRPIVEEVQKRRNNVIFEVFGDRSIRALFMDIPRVVTVHHLSWSDFRSYAHFRPGDLGLAPLLPSRFNAGRSGAKFLQITLSGGVGIYSDVPQYRSMVRDGIDGVLLRNDPALWVKAIIELVDDPTRREAMRMAAWDRAGALSRQNEPSLIGG